MPLKIEKAVFTTVERSLAARASLIMCGKDLITPLYPPRRCCVVRVGLFKCQGRWRKQFSLLWKSCEASGSLFMWGKDLVTPFYPPRRSCEALGEDRESRFHRCEGAVRLVQACLYVGTTWWRRFNLLGGAVKHVEVCLSSRDDRESSFHRCGGSESLVQTCLCAGKRCKAVFNSEEMLWSTCRPV